MIVIRKVYKKRQKATRNVGSVENWNFLEDSKSKVTIILFCSKLKG